MTTNDYQWQPMTTNDYILATFWLFFWLHSDYILATFLLQFDCILTKFWLHSDLPIKTNQITDSCVQLVSYLFKWKGNGWLYKLVCWVRTLNFFLFIDQHSSPWSTLAIISNQQSDTQGLCSAFQDRVSSILGKEKFWDQLWLSFLEQQINCQQLDHSDINRHDIHWCPLSFVLWRIPPPSQIAALSPLWHSFNGNIAFFDGISGRLCQRVKRFDRGAKRKFVIFFT